MAVMRDKLLEEVAELIEHGQGLKFVVHHDTGLLALEPDLIDKILAMLLRTATLMRKVTESFENGPPTKAPRATLSPQEVADLAYVCRAELVEAHRKLGQILNTKDIWKIAAEGEQAVARAIRALIPIEAAIREFLGHEPLGRSWLDFQDALTIREKLIEFWLYAKKNGTPVFWNQRSSFQKILDRITDLRQDPIYPYLPIDDKLSLRALQKRVLGFLEETGPNTEEKGRRLWQDLISFFDLLMHINRREELKSHDLSLLRRVNRGHSHLTDNNDFMPRELHDQLKSLASQDPALDELLIRDWPARTFEYKEPIQRLLAKLK